MHSARRSSARSALIACLVVISSLLVSAPAGAAPKLGPSLKVKGVSDGDTIKVAVDGRTERVRLIGIDTPELGRDGGADQCHAREATRQMQKQVAGKRVHLVRDRSQSNRDSYGRLLRYVYTAKGKRDVGRLLIAQGHGREYTFKKRAYQHRSSHLAAQRKASKAGLGLWACGSDAPEAEAPTTPPPAPAGCVIKGNIAGDGEKIYHVPGQRHYADTIITESKGERWFCSEPDAVAAGWRRAQV